MNGATNISSGGDRFTVFYNTVLNIPGKEQHFTYVDLAVWSSSIWYNFPNLVNGTNSEFRILEAGVPRNVSLATGLYTLSDLQSALSREVDNVGGDGSLFQLQSDEPTEKINIFLAGTVGVSLQIDFNIANSIRTLLGFDAQDVPVVPTTVDFNQLGDEEANFNQINSVIIHSSLADAGIKIGDKFSSAIFQVFLTTQPNFQQISQPATLQWIPADSLRGQSRSSAEFWITDEQNRPLNTRGEFWDVNLTIRAHKHTVPGINSTE